MPRRSKIATSLTGELDGRFFKTKMCKFHENGACSKGAACQFAHTPEDLHNRPDLFRTVPCLTILRQGICKYGEKCRYSHNPKDFPELAEDQVYQVDSAFYEESLPSSPARQQNLQSAAIVSSSEKGRNIELKHSLKDYVAPDRHTEADDDTASYPDTQSCSDFSTSSLESEFVDTETFDHANTDALENVEGTAAVFDLVVKNTFLQFRCSSDRSKPRRAYSADGRGTCM
jgi:hypothetical protein